METDTLDINYGSFADLDSKRKPVSGIAILKDVDCVSGDDLPDEYINDRKYKTDKTEEYYLFKGEMVGINDQINICVNSDMDSREFDIIEVWAEFRSVKSLAGSQIPVSNIENDCYTAESFKNHYLKMSPKDTKSLYEEDILEYNKSWNHNEISKRYNRFVDNVAGGLSMIMSITILLLAVFYPSTLIYYIPLVIIVSCIGLYMSMKNTLNSTIMKIANR